MTVVESKTPTPSRTERRVSPLVWILVAALGVALGTVAWLLFERDQTGTAAASDEIGAVAVSDEVASMLEERVAAINEGDVETAMSFYAQDATVTNAIGGYGGSYYPSANETVGYYEIAEGFEYLGSMAALIEPQGAPVLIAQDFGLFGDVVSEVQTLRYGPEKGLTGEFILVYRIDENGLISHQHTIGRLD